MKEIITKIKRTNAIYSTRLLYKTGKDGYKLLSQFQVKSTVLLTTVTGSIFAYSFPPFTSVVFFSL